MLTTEQETSLLTTQEPELISMSLVAMDQLRTLLAQQENPDLGLRVFVYPGGCSGMSYGMAFEDEITDEDTIYDNAGVRLIVDTNSAYYLKGAQIDFEDSLMGGGFRIFNPNAVRSCGCGHSFDTGEEAGYARACGCGH